jgi:hypothetical protein
MANIGEPQRRHQVIPAPIGLMGPGPSSRSDRTLYNALGFALVLVVGAFTFAMVAHALAP